MVMVVMLTITKAYAMHPNLYSYLILSLFQLHPPAPPLPLRVSVTAFFWATSSIS